MSTKTAKKLETRRGKLKPDYSRKVKLAIGGAKERVVALKDVQIPDLWHIAERYQDMADEIERMGIDKDDKELLAEHDERVKKGETQGAKIRELLIEVMYLAHDLKRNLANDVG